MTTRVEDLSDSCCLVLTFSSAAVVVVVVAAAAAVSPVIGLAVPLLILLVVRVFYVFH